MQSTGGLPPELPSEPKARYAAARRVKPSSLGAGAFALVVSLGLLAAGRTDARADGASFDGAWTLSPVTEAFTVQQWSAPCGPVPGPGTMMQGAEVMISSQDGELVIAGEARLLRTNQCLDPMTTLAPDTHSRETRSWRTRCVTPSNDPRRAIVNTAFFVAPGDDDFHCRNRPVRVHDR